MTSFLCMYVVPFKENNTLQFSNQPLLNSKLTRFCLSDAKTVPTPVPSGVQNEMDEDGESLVSPHSELVRVFLYFVKKVRPDISFAVGRLARFFSVPKVLHWVASRRVIWYLMGTKEYGFTYRVNAGRDLIGYMDYEFTSDHTDRKLVTLSWVLLAVRNFTSLGHLSWLSGFSRERGEGVTAS